MIFITGSESFVGKKLIFSLKKKQQKYIGIDIIKKKKLNYVCLDIRDKRVVEYIPRGATIIHLAAISNHNQLFNLMNNLIVL